MAGQQEWVFKAVPQFWKSYHKLPEPKKVSAKEAFKTFLADPFDPSLKPHRIARLSILWKRTVHSVRIEGDLRAVFTVSKNQVISLDIGTHDIYQ